MFDLPTTEREKITVISSFAIKGLLEYFFKQEHISAGIPLHAAIRALYSRK